MRLLSYNIFNGGQERLPLIIETIRKESPEYLTINEANGFALEDSKILKEIAEETNFPYFNIALSGEDDYHVAVFSKYPFKKTAQLHPLARACIVSLLETEIGELSIASFHLSPYSEDLRHPEIDIIMSYQAKYQNRILIGDMNSLAKNDDYPKDMVYHFNQGQLKKFTKEGKLRFDLIEKIICSGYYDIAKELGKNKESTVPTISNKDSSHGSMRLDYIFISQSLIPFIKKYEVIKNATTDKASDHYPIVAELY